MLPLFLDVGDVDLQENEQERRKMIERRKRQILLTKIIPCLSVMDAEQEVMLTKFVEIRWSQTAGFLKPIIPYILTQFVFFSVHAIIYTSLLLLTHVIACN